MYKERTRTRTVTETVQDYYAEEGDIIRIPGKQGLWVVESGRMAGGGRAHNDIIPDEWTVKARKLDTNTSEECPEYDPTNTSIEFTQHNTWMNDVIDGVEKVGQMARSYVFVNWET